MPERREGLDLPLFDDVCYLADDSRDPPTAGAHHPLPEPALLYERGGSSATFELTTAVALNRLT